MDYLTSQANKYKKDSPGQTKDPSLDSKVDSLYHLIFALKDSNYDTLPSVEMKLRGVLNPSQKKCGFDTDEDFTKTPNHTLIN